MDAASLPQMDQVGSIREPLLKPSFSKENMTDLLTLERYLKMVINRIPKDGSTVDLQPLFFSLVSPQISVLTMRTVGFIMIAPSF